MTALEGEVAGENSVAVTGTATGEKSLGVLGKGGLWGVRGEGLVGVRKEKVK